MRPRAIASVRSEMRVCACMKAVDERAGGQQHADADGRRHQQLDEREATRVAAQTTQESARHGHVPAVVRLYVALPTGTPVADVSANVPLSA